MARSGSAFETLCFTCQNAVPCKKKKLGCPWSMRFEPVPGWEAVPSMKNGHNTYRVISCPSHIPDEERPDNYEELYMQEQRVEAIKTELREIEVAPRSTFRYSI